MIEMARAHNLNIYKYLKYLLEHLPETRMADNELSRLAPWNPEVIDRCSFIGNSDFLGCKKEYMYTEHMLDIHAF